MKKNIIIAICLSFILMSCNWNKSNDEARKKQAQASINYVQAYSDTVYQYLDDNITNSSIAIKLIDINGDNIKELVIMQGPGQGGYLYTIYDNKTVQIKSENDELFGDYGVFVYYPNEGIFINSNDEISNEKSEVYSWYFHMEKDGKAKCLDKLVIKSFLDKGMTKYFINDDEVTKKEYDTYISKYPEKEGIVDYYESKKMNSKQDVRDYLEQASTDEK